MSRELPEKPNLEYLKRRAKELLHSMPQGKLADAQHTLANEYGFTSWAKLKSHVESLGLSPAEALKAAVCDSDAARVREVLDRYPVLRAIIDDPLPGYGFGEHALFAAVQRSDRATIDVLLRAGANIQKRTEWWAGGFGVLDDCDPSMVGFLMERGAEPDAHAASRLGMMANLRELVAADPGVVHTRGGDGQTPPHFASTVEVAEFLLTNGADIDERDKQVRKIPELPKHRTTEAWKSRSADGRSLNLELRPPRLISILCGPDIEPESCFRRRSRRSEADNR